MLIDKASKFWKERAVLIRVNVYGDTGATSARNLKCWLARTVLTNKGVDEWENVKIVHGNGSDDVHDEKERDDVNLGGSSDVHKTRNTNVYKTRSVEVYKTIQYLTCTN